MRLPDSLYHGWEPHLPAVTAAIESGTPWREALALRAKDLRLDPHTDLLLDESRASWLWLVETASHESALDLQGGVGSLASAFAYHFRQVHYLDTRPVFRQFAAARFGQDKQGNISLLGEPAAPLPFADRSLDCVAVHDLATVMMAWGQAGGTDHLAAEVRRVLRPGGCFYLGLDFGSGLAAAWTGFFSGDAIESSLRRAGFPAVSRYYAEPNHWLPQAMIPADRTALRFYERYRRTNFSRAREGIIAAGMAALLFPSRVILAAG